MGNLLNKNSHVFGGIIGLILPVLGFLLVYGIITMVEMLTGYVLIQDISKIKILGIAFNLWPIRYYFINKKYELTGRGILLVTFIYVVVYFWLQ